jgi:predicted aspartyl protease
MSPDGSFAIGVASYSDHRPGRQEPLPRIYVPFRLDGVNTWHLALLDTGGHYCILSPELAEAMSDRLVHRLGPSELWTAQGRVQGALYRHRIELIAEEGVNLGVDATVLVSPAWRGSTIIGYTGVLDRMRFAVDPQRNRFYFGPSV